ncbi:MAG: hypothetical protein QM702_21500 [Rubrivivax sp.]
MRAPLSVALVLLALGACRSSGDDPSRTDGGATDDGGGVTNDGGTADAPVGDGAVTDAGGTGTPSIQFIGRWDDSDALGPKTAWPGSRVVARFDGTDATAKITQTNGPLGGPTFVDVVVDGKAITTSLSGTQTVEIAKGLSPGLHTIEIVKRTESLFGTVRFEGFTFTGGNGLSPPTPRRSRRIEVLGDSWIDGVGVDGDKATSCAGGAPPQFDDVRKGVASKTADLVGADVHVMGYRGKGLARNADGQSNDTFATIFARTIPEVDAPWQFSVYVPDAVVILLGAADFDGAGNASGNLQNAYNLLLNDLHTRYGNTTPLVLTVPPSVKGASRAALETIIDAVIAGRLNADKPYNHKLVLPESSATDETGCLGHPNAAHAAAMAPLVAAEIKKWTMWP